MAIEDDIDFTSDLNNSESANTDIVSAHNGEVRTDQQTERAAEPSANKIKTDEQKAPEQELSLRDQLSRLVKGEAAPETRPRNPDGTFAPTPADPQQQTSETAAAPQQAAPVSPPLGFGPAEAEQFAKLPAELQQHVARTMETLNERAQKFSSYDQIEQQIAPRRQAWMMNGMTEGQAIGQLLALSDYATRDPASFVKWFSEQNRVDLEELVFGQEDVDPAERQRQSELNELRSELHGFKQQQQQQSHQQMVNTVAAFAEEKDAQGNHVRPYLEQLGDSWLPYIEMVRNSNPQLSPVQVLQQAYEQAVWANPQVRAKMQEAETAARDAARIREQQEQARRARSAGASLPPGVPSSPDAVQAGQQSKSMRDTIMAAVAQHS